MVVYKGRGVVFWAQYRVLGGRTVILFWVILIVMESTAFFALLGTQNNKFSNNNEITEFKEITGDGEIAVILMNFRF